MFFFLLMELNKLIEISVQEEAMINSAYLKISILSKCQFQ